MWPKYEEKYREDRLCCCEYRDLNGKSNHLLALCCNCQAIDESCERLVTCRRIPTDLWDQVVFVINDRLRIPCPGGARKVDFKKVVVFLIPPCALAISAVNIFLTISAILALSFLIHKISLLGSSHQYSFFLFLSMLLSFICLSFYLGTHQYIQPKPVPFCIVVLLVMLGLICLFHDKLFFGQIYSSVPNSFHCLW